MKWLSILLAFTLGLSGATIPATSPSYSHVSSAVASAVTGDTVTVPAGGAVWTNYLTITAPISIIGAGTNLTFLTNSIPVASPWNSSEKPPLFYIVLTNDALIRISGFFIMGNSTTNYTSGQQAVVMKQTPQSGVAGANIPIHAFRFDHNMVHRCRSRAVELQGSIYGVIDHCTFVDCSLIIEPTCQHDTEWALFTPPLYALGRTNNIVVEDCHYTSTEFSIGKGPAAMASGHGGHYVLRYCTILTGTDGVNLDGIDLHGNNYYHGTEPGYPSPQPGWRGSICMEVYRNTFVAGKQHTGRSMNLRGGTIMVFSNEFTWAAPAAVSMTTIQLTEEEGYLSLFNPVRTNWPAQDQITNSFFWGNTINGVPTNRVRLLVQANPNPNEIFLQQNRDYWLEAPNATNGSVAGNMQSYTPLVYPHPLVVPPVYAVTITSANPASGVSVTLDISDSNGDSSGTTPFIRQFEVSSAPTLTAPGTVGSTLFSKWQRDGIDFSSNLAIPISVDGNRTFSAIYVDPPILGNPKNRPRKPFRFGL